MPIRCLFVKILVLGHPRFCERIEAGQIAAGNQESRARIGEGNDGVVAFGGVG